MHSARLSVGLKQVISPPLALVRDTAYPTGRRERAPLPRRQRACASPPPAAPQASPPPPSPPALASRVGSRGGSSAGPDSGSSAPGPPQTQWRTASGQHRAHARPCT